MQDLAVFTVESKWRPNKPAEAKGCYGTTSIEHPAVQVRTGGCPQGWRQRRQRQQPRAWGARAVVWAR